MKSTFLTTLMITILTIGSYAQNADLKEQTRWSVEVDPATFVFKGYGIHLRMTPAGSDHLLLGLGAYAMDMPRQMVNLNEKNRNMGWEVRIDQAVGLFAEYHLQEVNSKWFVGAQLGMQQFKLEQEDLAGQQKFSNLLLMSYAGYTLRPFGNNLYIKPWAGLGYTSKVSGNNTLNAREYDIAPLIMFATLHIGYTF